MKPIRYQGHTLSTQQVMALRTLVDGDEENMKHIAANTLRSLQSKGLAAGITPTPAGQRWVEGYVSRTGDGPELLKERFRL